MEPVAPPLPPIVPTKQNVAHSGQYKQKQNHTKAHVLSSSAMSDSVTMDCSPPTCPWDSPGKNTGVVAMPSSRGFSGPRDGTCVSCDSFIAGRLFTPDHQGSPYYSQNADNKDEEKNTNNSQRKRTSVIQADNRNNGRQNLMLFHFENDKKKLPKIIFHIQ